MQSTSLTGASGVQRARAAATPRRVAAPAHLAALVVAAALALSACSDRSPEPPRKPATTPDTVKILMTALIAGLGLLPAALSHGIGSETQRPFAIVIVGGIVTGTIFTLILLPVAFRAFHGERED